MQNLEKEIKTLFELCKQANEIKNSVNIRGQRDAYKAVYEQSIKVMQIFEFVVVSENVRDFRSYLRDKQMILELAYLILKSVYYAEIQTHSFLSYKESEGLALLSYRVIKDRDYMNKFSKSDNWVRNEDLFMKSICPSVTFVHRGIMQKILVCLLNTLNYQDVATQEVPIYMVHFEREINYWLYGADEDSLIYMEVE